MIIIIIGHQLFKDQQLETFRMIVVMWLYHAGAVIALGLALGSNKYIHFVMVYTTYSKTLTHCISS